MSEPIDIEDYFKAGKAVPPAHEHGYQIRIDKTKYVVKSPTITGRELLTVAGKPVDKFGVYQIVMGKPHRIQLDEEVDLTNPGIERFTTLPLDQTEG